MTRTDLVLLSGGLDSATALAESVAAGCARLALTVDYGQRHRREIDAARQLADHYSVEWQVLDLSAWGRMLAGSALTDSGVEVPHGHYADPAQAATVVPNRNATLLSAAVGVAQSRGLMFVVTAVHGGDYAVYPDCRPDFIHALSQAVDYSTDGQVAIEAPFAHLDKTGIARKAFALGVPIGLTWSCYQGGADPCGRCGACVERHEALTAARYIPVRSA